MTKKKILILTSDFGLGHRSAAEAVEAALIECYGERCETSIINPLDMPDAPDMIQQLEEDYSEIVTENPSLYKFSYHALDAPLVSDLVEAITTRLINDTMFKIIHKDPPNIIVSTYPIYNLASTRAIEETGKDIALAVVITDLVDVQTLWFSSEATMHFVPTEAIREQAIENKIPGTRIQVTGLPVHPSISREKQSKSELREKMGWQQDVPTGLIVSSIRTSQLPAITRHLDQSNLNLQLVVVCGGDEKTYETLKCKEWNKPVHLYNWVDNMARLMKASDFIVSKAGGLIVSEALACGLPIILSEALPGQEIGNVKYVVENNAGAWAPSAAEVLATVISWLKCGEIEKVRANAEKIGSADAAYTIAKRVWGMAAA